MDKQTLKKHHFWILLALSVPLVFVVLAGTVFGVGSAAVEAKSKIDKRNKELTDAAPKCQQYLDNLELQKGELEKQRNRVWSEVYKAQAGLIHWPTRLARLDRAYFGDKVAEDDRAIFRENDVYLREYEELPAIIAPTKFAGNGWNAVLRYRPSWNTLPTSEDCWLAIEDLCVQREILKDIHNVNQLLARFLPVPQLPDETGLDDKKKQENKAAFEADKVKVEKEVRENLKAKDDEIVARFISPYWTLDLAVTRGTGTKPEMIFRGKLTNHTDRRQNVAKVNFTFGFLIPRRATSRSTFPCNRNSSPPVRRSHSTTFTSQQRRARPRFLRSSRCWICATPRSSAWNGSCSATRVIVTAINDWWRRKDRHSRKPKMLKAPLRLTRSGKTRSGAATPAEGTRVPNRSAPTASNAIGICTAPNKFAACRSASC